MKEQNRCTIRLETVTPERAAHDLGKAVGNNIRPMSEAAAQTYAMDMKAGRWHLNGETIKYDLDGLLVDGQTRLRAIVLADIPVQMFVAHNIESSMGIDEGRRRRLDQILKSMGELNFKVLAGNLYWLWRYQQEKGWSAPLRAFSSLSQQLQILKRNPSVRLYVNNTLHYFGREVPQAPFVSAFWFHAAKKDEVLAKWFVEKLGNGAELKEDQPVYQLRKQLISNRTRTRRNQQKLTQIETCAIVIIAWNLTRAARSCQILRWIQSGPRPQPFPEIE